MAERWTSRFRSCRMRDAGGKALDVAVALVGCLLAVSLVGEARAQSLTLSFKSRAVQPGELVLVQITAPPTTSTLTVSAFGTTWPAVKTSATEWRALVGIDLDTRPGTYPVMAEARAAPPIEVRRSIVVRPKQFRRRQLRVPPDYVNPPPELLERITQEGDLTRAAYARTSTEARWLDGFVRPVSDRANSSFGTRSVFNGEPRSPHAGTDFLSAAGTPVHAPAAGRVVVARDLFFTGNTVIIDHGLGVFSMLAHLSRIDVQEDADLAAGAVVGLVGATGRVTGPHLHWALRVGQARVDALSALAILPAAP